MAQKRFNTTETSKDLEASGPIGGDHHGLAAIHQRPANEQAELHPKTELYMKLLGTDYDAVAGCSSASGASGSTKEWDGIYSPPDFIGIQIMLRMLDESDDEQNETEFTKRPEEYLGKLSINSEVACKDNEETSPQDGQASVQLTKFYAPYLGPISFNTKERVLATANSQNAQATPTPTTSNKFAPSPYAKQFKKFEKRAAAVNRPVKPVMYEDMWTIIQNELRDKDEELRRRSSEGDISNSAPKNNKKIKFRGKRVI